MTTVVTTADYTLAVPRVRSRARDWLPSLYVVVALPAIVLFSIIMAPVQVADEFSHTMRADQISRGTMLKRIGGTVDGGIATYGHIFDELYFHPERKVSEVMAVRAGKVRFNLPDSDENFQNTAQYGPLLYIPGAVGITTGKAMGWTVAHTLLLTRILNGFVSAAIAFAALRILRHGKALAFTILLLPMSLSTFGSASQDAPLIALTILASAILSRAVDERRLATDGELALFLAIVIATTMARPSQLTLLTLLPAMSRWRQSPWRPKVALLAVTLVVIVLWIVTLRVWLMPPTPPEWNVADQFRIIVTKPWSLPLALLRSLADNWVDLWVSVIGKFGWYDTPLPKWVGTVGALACLCAALAGGNRPPYLRPALWSLLTFGAMTLAIAAALYMSWTPVGNATVHGLQGRYFLPILPLLGWLVPPFSSRIATVVSPLWIVIFAFPVMALLVAVGTLMDRYYGSWADMQIALTMLLLP
jgi:uncharacterized membrane protein